MKTVCIDGVEFVEKENHEDKPYVIIRADRAGVFAGNLISRTGSEVTMSNCRRIWYWDGAASLSQLAIDGTSNPSNCKFPAPIDNHIILGVIEILPCTQKAEKSIRAVKIWEK